MRKMLRVTLVLMLVLLLLALAVPVLGGETEGTGAGEGIVETPGASKGTLSLVRDLYPYEVQNFGGSRNIPD